MASGFSGLLDFSGLPVGEGFPLPIPYGFSGFLDFTGLPVAGGTGEVILPKTGHGSKVGGKVSSQAIVYYMRLQQCRGMRREVWHPPPLLVEALLVERLARSQIEMRRIKERRLRESQMYSVLLAIL